VVLSALGTFPAAFAFAGAVAQNPDQAEVFPAGAGEHAAWRGDAPPGLVAEPVYPEAWREVTAPNNVATLTTPTGSGLVIIPTFDSSITGNPNAAAIQAMINQAVAIYQSLFSDQITIRILFRYSNTQPDGSPMGTALGRSNYVIYTIAWNTYINALIADSRTANDTTANASLPASPLSTSIVPSSAGGRAIGLNTPGVMEANGNVGSGTFDGIVTLNSNQPFQFSRPPGAGNYDALRTTEHEVDEVLGLGSHLNLSGTSDLRPQDLFSWGAPGSRNLTSTGSRYFSINSGNTNIVGFNQTSPADFGDWLSDSCPQANPYVQNAFSCRGQFSDVTVSSPEGINLDIIGYNLTGGGSNPSTFGNISTRLRVETGNNVLIGGFIVTGTQAKKVIVRAIGPSLPLVGVLADPILELRDSSGGLIRSNDNWRSDQEAEIIATTIPPSNDLESAIVATLPANSAAYTAILRGVNNGTGIGVVEAYDLDQTVDSKLANISTRGLVQTGSNVMIGGLIVLGQAPLRVIVRAIGPSLPVPGAMGDPTLELHDGNGALIAANDNWRSDQEAEIIATGISPSNDLESAIVRNLTPGNYTAIVRGVNGTIGVALVEAYGLN
jgi:hypothetical protein